MACVGMTVFRSLGNVTVTVLSHSCIVRDMSFDTVMLARLRGAD